MKSILLKITGLSLITLLFSLNSLGQVEPIPISQGDTITDVCSNTVVISDSNTDGDYEPNESFQMTICFGEEDSIQIAILPSIDENDTLNLWDVDAESGLTIYAGQNTDGDSLGTFNSVTAPNGLYFQTDSNCITLVWESGASSSGAGFLAELNCIQDSQPFLLDVDVDKDFTDEEFEGIDPAENTVLLCFGDTINMVANPSFPFFEAEGDDAYQQLSEECTYTWDFGNGDIFEDVNLTAIEYAYPTGGGFFATLTVTDVMGEQNDFSVFFLIAPQPIFENVLLPDTICLGDQVVGSGSTSPPIDFDVRPSQGAVIPIFNYTNTEYIPSAEGLNGSIYSATIQVEGFADGSEVTNEGDILDICLSIEHTSVEDLEVWVTCPNGTTALLFDAFGDGEGVFPGIGFGEGEGIFLGDANDAPIPPDGSPSPVGIGFEYCFSDDPDPNLPLGTMEDEILAGNTVDVDTFNPGEAMVEGVYTPASPLFESLAGCPINGEWTLNVADNNGEFDDGFVFDWEIGIDTVFAYDTIRYSPSLVSAMWLNDFIEELSTDSFTTFLPTSQGTNFYTYEVTDEWGCKHTTDRSVYVRPIPTIEGEITCTNIASLNPVNAFQGGDYSVEPAGIIQFGDPEGGETEFDSQGAFGVFTVTFTEQVCGVEREIPFYIEQADQATLDYRPTPSIDPTDFTMDTLLCDNATIEFNAGDPEVNAVGWEYIWSLNGSGLPEFDGQIAQITAPGTVELTVQDGLCGSATASNEVVELFIFVDSDSLCDFLFPLEAEIEVFPDLFSGQWTSSPGTSLEVLSDTTASISPPGGQYGEYFVGYQDERCPADTAKGIFLWYEVPELTILPQSPDFCFEEDSLILIANVEGFGGDLYIWNLTALNDTVIPPNTDLDFDREQIFPPFSFVPNVQYQVSVENFDEFGKCPRSSTDEIIFNGIACTFNIPNIVTPNGDGRNDLFDIQFVEFFPGATLKIFNRWGREVFSDSAYDQYERANGGWDPEDTPGGVYFYELALPTINVIETGELTIITE
ncbi:MAG: gliding motility-associated C-terminal domain-containing protein [Bacteroidota bacterium]